jgi:exonuclease SbcC
VCEQEVKTLPRRRGAVGSIEEATVEMARDRERAEQAAAALARLEAMLEGEEKRRAELTRDVGTLTKEAALLLKQLTTYLAAPPDVTVEATLRDVQAEIERGGRAARAAEAALAAADRAASEGTAARDQLALEQSAEKHRLEAAERTRKEQTEKAAELAKSLATLVGAPADDHLLPAFGAALAAMRDAKTSRARTEAKLSELDQTSSREREEGIALESARQTEERERAAAAAAADEAAGRAADLRRSLLPRAAELGLALVESPSGEAEVRALVDAQGKMAAARMDLARRQALAEARAREIETQIAKRAELEAEKARAEGRARLHAVLDRDLKRDGFPAYLLEEALARLAADANRQLDNFPNATFSLAVEGQDFTIIDHANADERRSVRTLSGGESFIASLALAMAFAETLAALAASSNVTATLESLFLDEGFGTLDAENLDAVAGGLEALTSRARMVGVITHIPELAHRLPARILVSKRGNASEVSVDSG